MKTIYNDQNGSRDCQAVCLIVPMDGSVHKFSGKSIPGVFSVVEADYHKDGKWSYSTWEITHAETTAVVIFRQDFGTGKTFPQTSWDAGRFWLAEKAPSLSAEAFEAFIRASYPKTAAAWDKAKTAEAEFGFAATPEEIAAIRAAQEKIAADKAAYEAAEADRRKNSPFAALAAIKL